MPETQRQKRSLLSWIFSAAFGEQIIHYVHHILHAPSHIYTPFIHLIKYVFLYIANIPAMS